MENRGPGKEEAGNRKQEQGIRIQETGIRKQKERWQSFDCGIRNADCGISKEQKLLQVTGSPDCGLRIEGIYCGFRVAGKQIKNQRIIAKWGLGKGKGQRL